MTDDTEAGARIVGTLRAEAGQGVVRMEDCYQTEIEDLWSAVTDPSRLARWVAEVDGDLRVGGEFSARFTSGWDGTGRVEVCEPPRLLLVTLSPEQRRCDGYRSPTVRRRRPDAAGDRRAWPSRSTSSPSTGQAGRRTSRISWRISLGMLPWTGAVGGLSSYRPIAAWQTESRDARVRYRKTSRLSRAANTVGHEAQNSGASPSQAVSDSPAMPSRQ